MPQGQQQVAHRAHSQEGQGAPGNIAKSNLGILLIVLGIIAGVYTRTESQLYGLVSTTTKPYQAYMIPMLVGGVVLIVVGLVVGHKKAG